MRLQLEWLYRYVERNETVEETSNLMKLYGISRERGKGIVIHVSEGNRLVKNLGPVLEVKESYILNVFT
ncbi:hypothetical protein AAIE21_07520 [Paenibacillus sp. 102]|uniref:hypothetical protein n=1 Tax=Paenibacillus sp. 102 TaxID=3120823 RepID=UPI0031BB95D4